MSLAALRRRDVLLILATLLLGLAVDARSGLAGQLLVGAAAWGLMLFLLGRVPAAERRGLMTCLVIATLGELFLSLAWGLYRYRLDNVPLFVPPGHVLLLMLGFILARRMSEAASLAVFGVAALYALAAALLGFDTLGLPLLLLLLLAAFGLPRQRRLYASTFLLALALELYGTWLGNWAWAREVPVLPLATTNPPVLAGAFYCVLDALVAASLPLLGAVGLGRRTQVACTGVPSPLAGEGQGEGMRRPLPPHPPSPTRGEGSGVRHRLAGKVP